MKLASWIEQRMHEVNVSLEQSTNDTEKRRRLQQKLLLMDLCIFPEATVEITFPHEAALRIVVAKFASDLAAAEERDDVGVGERRSLYALQIATYVASQ